MKTVATVLTLQYPLVDTKKLGFVYTKNDPSLFHRHLESGGAFVIK